MKKNGFLKKVLMGVAVSLLTISIVGFLTTLSKSLFGSDTKSCEHLAVTSSTVVKPATCTEDGEYRFTCRDCGEYVYKSIPASHKLEVIEGTPATCTEDGTTDSKRCTVCDEVFVEMTSIPATGHKGELGETCETCGEKIVLIPEDATLTQVSVGEKVAGKTYRIVASSPNGFYLSNGDNTLQFWVNGSFACCSYCFTAPNLPFIHVEGVEGNSGHVDVTFVEGVDFSHTCSEYPDGLNFVITSETTISEIHSDLTIYRAERLVAVSDGELVAGNTYRFTVEEDDFGFSVGDTFFHGKSSGWVFFEDCSMGTTAPFRTVAGDGFVDVTFIEGVTDTYYGNPQYDEDGSQIGYESLTFTLTSDMTLSTYGGQVYRVEKI